MSDILHVENREITGTRSVRRLRSAGQVPAVLYGHGKENISLSVALRDVESLVRHGSHIVELQGSVNESALVKEVQWDALGVDVLHLDLARIDAAESVEVQLTIELKGVAPGIKVGGIIKQYMHDVTVRCPANQLPDKLELSINQLELDSNLTAADLEVPEAADVLCNPSDVVVTCIMPIVVETEEEEVEEVAAAEPEVIGRPADGEESQESDS